MQKRCGWFGMVRRLVITCVTLAIAASGFITNPAQAAAPPYDPSTGSGTVPCSTTGFFTVAGYVVTGNSSCVGSAVIPDGVTSIGASAFQSASGLESVLVPASVQTIGNSAFQAAALKSVIFEGSSTLISIGQNAFYNAALLESINIPASVTYMGNAVFQWAGALTDINVDSESSSYSSVDGVLFTKDQTILLKYPQGKLQSSYTIPAGVTSIGSLSSLGAFLGVKLTSITIPESVTVITEYSFRNDPFLNTVIFQGTSNLTTIKSQAFYMASGLQSITIPAKVHTIGDGAFQGASALTLVRFLGDAPTLQTDAFTGIGLNPTAFVRTSSSGFPSPGETWNVFTVASGYAVTYNAHGATAGAVPSDPIGVYNSGDTVGVLENSGTLEKSNYTFGGWNTRENGCGTPYVADGTETFTMSDADVVLYAQWTAASCNVTYDANGASGGSAPSENNAHSDGTLVTVLANTGMLEKTGYLFDGWNTSPDGSGASYVGDGTDTFTMGATDIVLYAQWLPKEFTVTYDANGASSGEVPTDQLSSHAYGTSVVVLANTKSLLKSGHIVTSWNTQPDGSGTSYAADGTATFIMGDADIVLYAEGYRVTFNCGGSGNFDVIDSVVTRNSGCTGSAIIPSGVTSIGAAAFQYALGLESVSIPASVQTIRNSAFQAAALKSVSFEGVSSLTMIDYNAFYEATLLESINIPASVTYIRNGVFQYAGSLTAINVDSGNPNYSSIDGVLFNKDHTALLKYPEGNPQVSYSIPAGVTSIGDGTHNSTFINAQHLQKVTIPKGVTAIFEYAFRDTALRTVVFEDVSALTAINVQAFYRAHDLSTLVFLGTSLGAGPTVGEDAFSEIGANLSAYIQAGASGFLTNAGPSWQGFAIKTGYPVVYNGHGASSGRAPELAIPLYALGDSVPVLSNSGSFAKKGYALTSWNTRANGKGVSYSAAMPETFTMSSTSVVLYAQWTKSLTVTTKPSVTGKSKVSKTVSAKKGKWNTPTPKFDYQWYSCTTPVTSAQSSAPGDCNIIFSATRSKFKLTSNQVGSYVLVAVTAHRGALSTTWWSKSTSLVN